MRMILRGGLVLSLVAPVVLFAAGCGLGDNKQTHADTKPSPDAKKAEGQAKKDEGGEGSKHSGWWCDEHGIPEAECSMCSKKVADAFKAKGDWCDKHNRARSQCFKCDPSLKEKFAARYRARYGKEPPPITDDD